MLSQDEIKFLEACSDTELMKNIIERHRYLPEIIITISGYTLPINEGQDNFHKVVMAKDNEARLQQAACLTEIPVKEYRVFVSDPEDKFPYNVQVNGEIEGQFETMDEATKFLLEYLKVRKG